MKNEALLVKINAKEAWVMLIAAVTILAVVVTATVTEAASHKSKDCCDTTHHVQ